MTQVEQVVSAIAIVGFLSIGAIAAWVRRNRRAESGDPYGLRRMRRTLPRRYRTIVESARCNSIVLLLVGIALLIVGTLTGAATGSWLLAIASPLGGGALVWFAIRWARRAWRIKLD
jgi:hypothetical protein